MESRNCIQGILDEIEEKPGEYLTIESLADHAGLSPFYFQRLFKRLTGKPVMEYIKLRRLALAADELAENEQDSILGIALKFGFESHETFTRSFKEAYGMPPSVYRNNPVRLSHYLKPEILLQYALVDEDVPLVTKGIVLEVTRHHQNSEKYYKGFTVKARHQAPGIDTLDSVWQRIHQYKESWEEYVPDGTEVGVGLAMGEGEQLTYFAGAQVNQKQDSDEFDFYILQQGEYIVCKFEAENFEKMISDTLDKVYEYMHGWIMKKEIPVKYEAIEMYYERKMEVPYMELWIPVLR